MPETLRIGSQGPAVSELQTRLNTSAKPYPLLAIDGIFGPKTEGAVRQWQRTKGIPVDGIAGPKTWQALGVTETADTPSESPAPPEPTLDGQVCTYSANPNFAVTPLIYYINGIQTSGAGHGKTLQFLSELTEREVNGVYNRSAGVKKIHGWAGDFLQCFDDWESTVRHKLAEKANGLINSAINRGAEVIKKAIGKNKPFDPVNVAGIIRKAVPEDARIWLVKQRLKGYNLATASLFSELEFYYGQPIHLVAHSQGNIIVCDALWAMVVAFGEESLTNLRVYSLASPSPAWPLGIRHRRKVYGHTNDPVPMLADPHNWTAVTDNVLSGKYGRHAGDWRKYGDDAVSVEAHDVELLMTKTNFANRMRRVVGLPPDPRYSDPPAD